MMGFYPDCPGEPDYTLVPPVFDRVEISLDPRYSGGNGTLVIENRAGDGYAERAVAGGRRLKGFRISHTDLVGAGMIVFE